MTEALVFSYISERDIDLLLVEEFRCSKDFVKWFWQYLAEDLSLPKQIEIQKATAFHSVTKTGKASGETDIVLNIEVLGEKKIYETKFFIENKIDTQFQKEQPERYQQRVKDAKESGHFDKVFCVIFAPNEYLESEPGAEIFDASVAYEDIADYFQTKANNITDELSKRSMHKKIMVEQGIYKYRRGYSPEVDQQVTNFWKNYYELATRDFPQLRLRNPGAKPIGSDFVHFIDALETMPPLPRCTIKHKMRHGRVDLEISGWAKYFEQLKPKFKEILEG